MFTGLIRHLGTLAWRRARGGGARVRVEAEGPLLERAGVGSSVAVMGACLTVAARGDGFFEADLSGETLLRTTLGALPAGAPLSLEPALRAGEPLDGHLVSGHVDATTGLLERAEGEGLWLFELPGGLAAMVAPKGSVAIDGVSLTVVEATGRWLSVSLIPETLNSTALKQLRRGDRANLEADPFGRYVARCLALRGAEDRLGGFAERGWGRGG
jgi:riboflavin synthase